LRASLEVQRRTQKRRGDIQMLVKVTKALVAIGAVALGTSMLASPALAINLNTHGAVFQRFQTAPVNSVEYLQTGVRPVAGANTVVIGAVPRSAIPAATQTVILDGTNPAGVCSTASFTSFSSTGVLQSSLGGNGCGTYSLVRTLNVSPSSYISVVSSIPNGGLIRGVTAVQ
jgi:hypothetical protein